MSNFVVSFILSLIIGLLSMNLLVSANAQAQNPYRIVWGSLAFWVVIVAVAYFTIGRWSFAASLVGGIIAFWGMGMARPVLLTWSRALIEFANSRFIRHIVFMNAPLRYMGVRLERLSFYKRANRH